MPSPAWETRNQTKTVYDSFLSEALDLNPSDIPIADIHRLPQKPIFKVGKKMTRPIIVKLTNALDKSLIFSQLRKLKQYNAKRSENNQSREPVFITEHLPPAFQQQKKVLMPFFKEARLKGQKTQWRVVNAKYSLFIDNKKCVLPKTASDQFSPASR